MRRPTSREEDSDDQVMDMSPAHMNIVKRANLLVNGPRQGTDASRGGAEADGGKEEPPARAVGNVLVQQVAEARLM